MDRSTRRRMLRLCGVSVAGGLSGCSGVLSGGDEEDDIKDTDGDGVIDSEDYAPRDPEIQREEQVKGDTPTEGQPPTEQQPPSETETMTEEPRETPTGTPSNDGPQYLIVDDFESGSLDNEWRNEIGTWGGGTDTGREAYTVQSQTAPEGNYVLKGDSESASDGHSSILRDDFNISEDGTSIKLYAKLGPVLNGYERANKIEFLREVEAEENTIMMLDQKNRTNENNARVGNGNTPNSVLDSTTLVEFKSINFSEDTVGEVVVGGTTVGSNLDFLNEASQLTAITTKQGHYSQSSDIIVDEIKIV